MHQELPHEKVHSLYIVRLIIITAKGPQHLSEFFVPFVPTFEVSIFGKSTAQVSVNLLSGLLFWCAGFQGFVVGFAG